MSHKDMMCHTLAVTEFLGYSPFSGLELNLKKKLAFTYYKVKLGQAEIETVEMQDVLNSLKEGGGQVSKSVPLVHNGSSEKQVSSHNFMYLQINR